MSELPHLGPERGELDPIELADPEQTRALQLERLQWSLAHAYENVAHYRAAFDAAGLTPGDCRTLEDLRHFPLTSKQDLRDHYPFGMFAVPQSELRRVHASSGTTGQPTVVGYTADDIWGCASRPGRRASRPTPRSSWSTW